jgi:hypothetical protein
VAIGRRSQSDLLSFEKQLQINIPTEMKKCEELREQARDLYLRDVNKTDKLKVAKSFMSFCVLWEFYYIIKSY